MMEFDLALEFARVVEDAAIASAHTMGTGRTQTADQAATEAMRDTMDTVPMRGTIVIGEGERDEAPMLYIGEKVGAGWHDGAEVPAGGYRRRSAGRHQPLRHRRSRRHHRAGRIGKGRAAERSGLLHGENRRRPFLQGRGGPGRAGRGQPEKYRAPAEPRRGRSGDRRARPPASSRS